MIVKNIYIKFSVPPNLQRHMLLVTKLALCIDNHWKGPKIDNDLLTKACLLHDIGNIVKFNLDKYSHLLEEEIIRIDFWKQKQKEVIAKYGKEDQIATKLMLEEIGIDQEIVKIIQEKEYANAIETEKSDNWSLKIFLYADLRVAPSGIASLQERLKDLMDRLEKYRYRNDLFQAALRIEKQIQEKVNIDLTKISIADIKANDEELLETNV
jgi:hypothetical protein